MMWKLIEGFDGMYMVSTNGEVFSFKTNRILSQTPDKDGYRTVKVGNRRLKVHRLVAQAFLSKVDDKNEVNHKDECKYNNHVSNLEWVNRSENCSYGHAKDGQRKAVLQFDLKGNFIKEYKSYFNAGKQTGVRDECIARCVNGRYKTAGGYIWRNKYGREDIFSNSINNE